MSSLYARYGHCYAVVSGGEVAGVFGDFGEAVDYAMPVYGPGAFIAQEVGPDPSAYTQESASMWVVA